MAHDITELRERFLDGGGRENAAKELDIVRRVTAKQIIAAHGVDDP